MDLKDTRRRWLFGNSHGLDQNGQSVAALKVMVEG